MSSFWDEIQKQYTNSRERYNTSLKSAMDAGQLKSSHMLGSQNVGLQGESILAQLLTNQGTMQQGLGELNLRKFDAENRATDMSNTAQHNKSVFDEGARQFGLNHDLNINQANNQVEANKANFALDRAKAQAQAILNDNSTMAANLQHQSLLRQEEEALMSNKLMVNSHDSKLIRKEMDRLREEYPNMSDAMIYDHAVRLLTEGQGTYGRNALTKRYAPEYYKHLKERTIWDKIDDTLGFRNNLWNNPSYEQWEKGRM